MNWSNVRLIFFREVRDQLRDRRTLFVIAILPILLYPLLGMSFFQIAQFVQEHPTTVLIVGTEQLPETPPLLQGEAFAPELFTVPAQAKLLRLSLAPDQEGLRTLLLGESAEEAAEVAPPTEPADLSELARQLVRRGDYEVIVYFPATFSESLEALRSEGLAPGETVPQPQVFYNMAEEKSQIAYARVTDVLRNWKERIVDANLVTIGINQSVVDPFRVDSVDVADKSHRDAAIWSKVFPFMVLLWALTGAFYPAVDLCAGEKERGTLETLLSSPAERSEIVWGKLLTVMCFSMATVVLNLLSIGLTGFFVLRSVPQIGPPPMLAPLWLLLTCIPVSALFSALCLALAALARSSKEGQYYLMPLVLVTMPLVIMPMAPGVELTLGNSLIPITGIVLLLRELLEGDYLQAAPYAPPVIMVTLGCCLLSIRWAIDQFNSESVLFRESERWGLGLWVRHLLRDRGDTPSVAEAVFCGALILLVQFFMNFALPRPERFADLAMLAVVSQLVVILTPALLMTIMLTRRPGKTLLLRRPPLWSIPVAILAAFAIHPLANTLRAVVFQLYPLSDEVAEGLARIMPTDINIWAALAVLALMPAVCEELAFRGFILSGLRHLGHSWWAISLSSFFFAITHALFQQSLIAFVVGLFIGYLAVQTASILPCMLFHILHNSLALITAQLSPQYVAEQPIWQWFVWHGADDVLMYRWPVIALGAILIVAIVAYMRTQPHPRTREERIQEAIEHSAATSSG